MSVSQSWLWSHVAVVGTQDQLTLLNRPRSSSSPGYLLPLIPLNGALHYYKLYNTIIALDNIFESYNIEWKYHWKIWRKKKNLNIWKQIVFIRWPKDCPKLLWWMSVSPLLFLWQMCVQSKHLLVSSMCHVCIHLAGRSGMESWCWW